MKYVKYIGISLCFLIIIGLLVGGFFLLQKSSKEVFTYKSVTELPYGKIDIDDLVEQNITCKQDECEYHKKELTYTLSEINSLGTQDLVLTIKYEGQEYTKTFNVNIVDKESPLITLTQEAIILKVNESFEAKDYIKEVSDNFDNLSIENITIDNPVDMKKSGEYEVTYTISDSSNNEAIATLKVIVKDKNNNTIVSETKKSTVSSSTPKKEPTQTNLNYNIAINKPNSSTSTPTTPPKEDIKEDVKVAFKWKMLITGSATLSKELNESNPNSKDSINLEANFTNKITIDFTLFGNGNYQITLEVLDEDGKSLEKETTTTTANAFNLPIPLEGLAGSSTLIIKIKDLAINQEFTEELFINITEPKTLKDVLIKHEDKSGYEAISVIVLGGNSKNMQMEYGFLDSKDPRVLNDDNPIEDIIEDKGDYLKLKYQKGYYYTLAFEVTENDKTITKTITIKK